MQRPLLSTPQTRFAQSADEATHRYRTTVHRGPGYVADDGYRYVVAADAPSAFDLARTKHPVLSFVEMQALRDDGKWSCCTADDLEPSYHN